MTGVQTCALPIYNMEVYIDMLNIELGLQDVIIYVDGGTTLVKFTPEKQVISIEVIR